MKSRIMFVAGLILLVNPLYSVSLSDLEMLGRLENKEYDSARDVIVQEGKPAVPYLKHVLEDSEKPWKVRFLAGVCLERIQHPGEFEKLLKTDWINDPELKGAGPLHERATGYAQEVIPVFHKRLEDAGLWYAYLECFGRFGHTSYPSEYKTIDTLVLEKSSGLARSFAAQIAESGVDAYYRGQDRSGYVYDKVLFEFIKDGTWPSGAYVLLNQVQPNSECGGRYLLPLISAIDDIGYLRTLGERCPFIEANYGMISKRIAEIEAISATNRMANVAKAPADKQAFLAGTPTGMPIPEHCATDAGSRHSYRGWAWGVGVMLLPVCAGVYLRRHREKETPERKRHLRVEKRRQKE
jgi:hypothetical protein